MTTLQNYIDIYNRLPRELFKYFDYIQQTDYNTIVLDFKKNNDILSLEIGKSSIGYFVEIDNKLVCLVENDSTEEPFALDTMIDLNTNIQKFLQNDGK